MKLLAKCLKNTGSALIACLILITLAPTPSSASADNKYPIASIDNVPYTITTGPDGNLWLSEGAENAIAKMTPAGDITQYQIPSLNANPASITKGPDGNLWFTELTANKIGRITPSGEITEYQIPTPASGPIDITSGSDANLWFTETTTNKIGKITPEGEVSEYLVPTTSASPFLITKGPDNNLWFTEFNGNRIGKITSNGEITEYYLPTSNANPAGITKGPDNNLWFTEFNGNRIGKITSNGEITEYSLVSPNSRPVFIITGPDNNLWISETAGNQLAKATTAGAITEYKIPSKNKTINGLTVGPDNNVWYAEFARAPQWLHFVSRVPKPVAQAIPYVILTLMALLATGFIWQSIKESNRRRQLQAVRKRQSIQAEERENFNNLINHYFNTPITLLTGGYELLVSQNLISQDQANQRVQVIKNLAEAQKKLLNRAKQAGNFDQPEVKPARLWPVALTIILLGLVMIASHYLFYLAMVFKPTTSAIITEGLLYLLLAQAVFFGYRNYHLRREQAILEAANFDQEKALNQRRTEFLADIYNTMSAQIKQVETGLQTLSPEALASPLTKPLRSGVDRLHGLYLRLALINQFMSDDYHETEPIELDQTVQSVINDKATEFMAKHIKITTEVNPIKSVSFKSGYTGLVLASLVDNAIKFSEDGSTIDIASKQLDDNTVEIDVIDSGMVIEEDRLQELFQPFSRAGSSLQFDYEGVGLSLFIDKLLLEKLGGRIAMLSSQASGTRVTLQLPIYRLAV